MEYTCQRCGETLSTEAAYCPHCAAPQLRWQQPDTPLPEEFVVPSPASSRRRMHWDAAIRLTLAIAIITGILCGFLSPGLLLWLVCGIFATVAFYRRRYPVPHIDARFGTRLGMLFGLITAAVSTFIVAGVMLYQRFVLHQPALVDQMYGPFDAKIDQAAANAATTTTNAHDLIALTAFFHSPEFKAGSFIVGSAIFAAVVVTLAAITGAVAVRLTRPRPRSV